MHRLSQLKASFESNTVKYKLKVSMIPAPKTEQPLCRLLQVPLLVCPVSVCLSENTTFGGRSCLISICMLCFYRSLLILCFVFYLYFVFLLLPTWRIKPEYIPRTVSPAQFLFPPRTFPRLLKRKFKNWH